MGDIVASIETFIVRHAPQAPYLSSAAGGLDVNERGYFVRPQNRTIYPVQHKSVIVKVTTRDGVIGWGETYGLSAPAVIAALNTDVIGPFLRGRDPLDVQVIWEDFYDMMRVRGYHGGFYLDALAALDIALWDICGKILRQPLGKLLGGIRRTRIPAYISGLPQATLPERIAFAKQCVDRGYKAFKLHAAQNLELERDLAGLREALGTDVELMVDLHWRHTAGEAAELLHRLSKYQLSFAEAPVKPEDVGGLAELARRVPMPLAVGEEWRTVFDARSRIESRAASIVQPEMGHTGITQFMRIARLAEAFHARVMPHATIGFGIFMAASLHASSTLLDLPMHEYQPTIFDVNLHFLETDMACKDGAYVVPSGHGLGVEPRESLWTHVVSE
ncbi:mandelate racemase/muconate lactonizing enzyme family protein [Peristeroidobacter soli]|uniref:mandelate racemase/muconate lactonizing enzyme family protein n=1 Tax=Peristeroidobacter soli TaxID=2497877 RepID=UPI00101C6C6F|nr:mandelate racemase/muconate lactonizing enzyme family protein [Peristeroidobacter soli]